MPSPITKAMLAHLAELARLELTAEESKKLLKDISRIVDYFAELKKVDTDNIIPLTGGTMLHNVFRDDEIDFSKRSDAVNAEGRIIDEFPETEKGYLKVPKVL